MKYTLEIQSEDLNIKSDEIVERVKQSLKERKVLLTKAKNLNIYYQTATKIVYYTCTYLDKEVKSQIYL